MAKKAATRFLILMAAFSVVVGSVIPHHHHHGEDSVICFANDIHPDDQDEACACCDHGHHTSDGDCCGVKTNLVTHFGDSRKEELHCAGDDGHLFHGGHTYIILVSLFENAFQTEGLSEERIMIPPYCNFYHSVLAEGHIGRRAPPVA